MSDRLVELQRQRSLVQEHLAWLERQIAAELHHPGGTDSRAAQPATATAGKAPLTPVPKPVPGPLQPDVVPAAPAPAPATPLPVAADAQAEAMLDKYRVGPETLRTDVRKGCLMYFIAAFVLLGAIVAALYFVFTMK